MPPFGGRDNGRAAQWRGVFYDVLVTATPNMISRLL